MSTEITIEKIDMGEMSELITKRFQFKWEKKYKVDNLPFADKIPFIRSLILNTINNEIIEKIYLFGSYAYGQPSKKSDIDICIVVNNNQKRFRISGEINSILHDYNIVPADILVFRNMDFYYSNNEQGIQNTIMQKGIILYE
jgi:predicted nucleotidyltransferase